jgi:hypothetical protein
MEAERYRLTTAIAALQRIGHSGGGPARRKKRRLSAAARKRISDGMGRTGQHGKKQPSPDLISLLRLFGFL